jgi:hypothetical protein
MPTDLDDYETGGTELLFADDLQQNPEFRLRELAVYEAEEVRAEVGGDVPKFGNWLPITTDAGDAWVVALGELVEEVKIYENPLAVTLRVTRCVKSGTDQTAPYEVNVEQTDGDSLQSSL